MNEIKMNIKRISENFNDISFPYYATEGSSGMDIRAAIDDEIILEAGKVDMIPTNLIVEIPEGFDQYDCQSIPAHVPSGHAPARLPANRPALT